MYRRPKFLEVLIEIREQLAAEADYDVELLAQRVRSETDEAKLPGIEPISIDTSTIDVAASDPYYSEFLENLQ